MIDKSISETIGRGIREGKYLDIRYKNKEGGFTRFWICVIDVNSDGALFGKIFNLTKDEPIKDGKIFLAGIQSAEILVFSQYDVPKSLIDKLENDEALKKFNFNRYNDNLLNYYLECYKANQDPFLHKQHLIPGLDLNVISEQNSYKLNREQMQAFMKEIYQDKYDKFMHYELAFSEFSIDLHPKGKFIVAYRKLRFDPVEETLYISASPSFNPSFYIKSIKHSLSHYLDVSPADFESDYLQDKHATIEKFRDNFRSGEMLNTKPEIVVLGYKQSNINQVYDAINSDIANTQLEVPIKAFFEKSSVLDRQNRTEPNIVLYDEQVNIDQLRTVYSALKYPITIVQGPPGTGKTQTILNIVINCITSNRTLLIASNNNTPIDGIKDKLVLGQYKGKDILFPLLRLGNDEKIKLAIAHIRKLYEFETNDVPKETLLLKIKESSKEKNKLLNERIKQYEDRIYHEQILGFINTMLETNKNTLLEQEKEEKERKLNDIPKLEPKDVFKLFEVVKGNDRLLQFFYYESLKYVKRLKTKAYQDLVEILYMEEEAEQVKSFKKWLSIDANLEKLTKVFPVILSTNLSCLKLGHSYKFDLLTLDEAGQCDIATSLIPISKCKNMVLIGDTNQLKPIVVFEETINKQLMQQYEIPEAYDYFNNSILSTYKAIDHISNNILLSYHYRCGEKIINYSNQRFYENKLNLTAIRKPGELKILDVNNLNQQNKNANVEEVISIVNYIKENKLTDAFILTPFRHQEALLNHALKEAKEKQEIDESVSCGTIHKVQGQENRNIIISTSISDKTTHKTYDWIKNNSQLINVGVTRAKEQLVFVVDRKAIDILSHKDDDLYALYDYISKNGQTQVAESTSNKFTIGFSNDSKFEDEFYKTMSHYCTVKGGRFKRNVKVTEVFPEERNNPLLVKKEFDGVLFNGPKLEVVFEVHGTEHSSNKKRQASDRIKREFLNSRGIKFIEVPNYYVKHYEIIGELINKIKGESYQMGLF